VSQRYWHVNSCQSVTKRLRFGFCGNGKEFEQIFQATADGTDVEALGVFNEFCHAHIGVAHPETLGEVGHAAAVLRVAEAGEDCAFRVAGFDRLLFCDPMFCVAKKILGFYENEMLLGAV
jgi:hypothetical protein